jgi:hypothetical protein
VTELDAMRLGGDGFGFAHHVLFLRLGIKGIEMAHSAGHEQIDDMFGLRLGIGDGCRGDRRAEHRQQVHAEEGARRGGHETTAVRLAGLEPWVGGHGLLKEQEFG